MWWVAPLIRSGKRVIISARGNSIRALVKHIDTIIHFAETLLGIRLKNVKKYRYSSLCPFHADTKDSLMVYVNKKDEVRFHCFGACKGDWDIYDMLKPVVNAISGFSLERPKTDAQGAGRG